MSYNSLDFTPTHYVMSHTGMVHSEENCSSLLHWGMKGPTRTKVTTVDHLEGKTVRQALEAIGGKQMCYYCFPQIRKAKAKSAATANKAQEAKDDTCPGSGSDLNKKLDHRVGYYTGNYGTCGHCGEKVTLTSKWALRKHKI